MKKIAFFLLIGGIIAISSFFFYMIKKEKITNFTIGILQTASHPALDSACQEFINTIQSKLGNDTNFILKNAQGNPNAAYCIASQFSSNKKIDAFFTLGTLATQALHQKEKHKCIILSAVSDPSKIGVVYENSNVCGITDSANVESIANNILAIFPKKKIGILYTIGELNSESIIEKIEAIFKKKGINFEIFGFNSELDIRTVTELACRNSSILLLPTDNTIALSIQLISDIAKKYTIPIITMDVLLLPFNCCFAQGANYKEQGAQCALFIYDILKQKKNINEIGIIQPNLDTLYINEKMAANYKISIPKNINTVYR